MADDRRLVSTVRAHSLRRLADSIGLKDCDEVTAVIDSLACGSGDIRVEGIQNRGAVLRSHHVDWRVDGAEGLVAGSFTHGSQQSNRNRRWLAGHPAHNGVFDWTTLRLAEEGSHEGLAPRFERAFFQSFGFGQPAGANVVGQGDGAVQNEQAANWQAKLKREYQGEQPTQAVSAEKRPLNPCLVEQLEGVVADCVKVAGGRCIGSSGLPIRNKYSAVSGELVYLWREGARPAAPAVQTHDCVIAIALVNRGGCFD